MRPAIAILFGLFLAGGLLGFAQEPEPGADEKLLKAAGIGTDDKGLLEFFRNRSLTEVEQEKLEATVRLLDDGKFQVRDQAAKRLVQYGKLAIPFLKKALIDGSLEMQRRVDLCLRDIEAKGGPEQPAAAARLLAQRKTPGAADVLLNYLPFADDEWLEEQVINSLATIALTSERADPVLINAAKDRLPGRRAFAAYVLGQRGELEQRALVRGLLTDPDAMVRLRARAGLLGKQMLDASNENHPADREQLSQAKLTAEPASLLGFLTSRTLAEEKQAELRQLVEQLGNDSFSQRERATKKLAGQGPPAIPYLRDALASTNAEIAAHARLILDQPNFIRGSALPLAVVRMLTAEESTSPAKEAVKSSDAVAAILGYLPFADDEAVYDEALKALCLFSVRTEKIDPLFQAALSDPLPARRAAAAYVLARVGTRDQVLSTRKLLGDESPLVRYQTALGLLSAKQKRAVDTLVDLYAIAPDSWAYRIEEMLMRLAGDKTPAALMGTSDRTAQAKAWKTWWRENDAKIDLARLTSEEHRLGLYLIVQFDGNAGNGQGLVLECGRDGKARFTVNNLNGPMDAQVLPGNRLLVCENNLQRLKEIDIATGKVLWDVSTNNPQGGYVVACQRLPGGNTFYATYNQLVEITPGKKDVYRHTRNQNSNIFGAQKTRQGKIVYVTAQSTLHVVDAMSGKDELTLNLGQPGGWIGVEALSNGRFLVAMMTTNEVREIDSKGTVHWRASIQGAFRATRLPNGNTVVVSMTTRQVVELDQGGRRVWEKTLQGRPWMVRTR